MSEAIDQALIEWQVTDALALSGIGSIRATAQYQWSSKMSIKEGFPHIAKQKRAEFIAYRNSIRLVDMEAPTPGPENLFLDALETDGPKYLPAAHFNKPLVFMLPVFAGQDSLPPSLVEAYLTVDGSADPASFFTSITPLNPLPPIPMTLSLASKDLPGERRISLAFEFGGNPADVKSYRYMVDTVAPLLDKSVVPPQPAIDYGLDPDDFASGKTVTLTYAVWANQRQGDTITCYIGRDQGTKKVVEAKTIGASDVGKAVEFSLNASHVAGFDGRYVVFCEAVSYPGVISTPSAETVLYVFKDRKPAVTEPLHVPQIIDPSADVIGIQELTDGFSAGLLNPIPNFNSSLDKIVYVIDGEDQPEKPITQIPFLNTLDNNALIKNGHGNRTVKLGYRVKRGDFYYPAVPIETDYLLDVRKPCAPFNPDKPNPPDETMGLPWIQGPVSTERNKLTAADKQNAGAVKGFLPFHPQLKKGDVAQFYYGGAPVPPPGGQWTFPADDSEDPSQPISFEMDWTFIATIPDSKTTQLQVVVTHDLNVNEAISTSDYADVSTTPIVLSAAGFRYMHANPLIGLICSSLRKLPDNSIVLVIQIPADTRLADKEITVNYAGYATQTPGNPISGSEWSDTKTPSAAEAAVGFDVYMPYEFMLATFDGYGRVDYQVTIDQEFVQKDGAVVRVNAYNGSDTCDITKPIVPV